MRYVLAFLLTVSAVFLNGVNVSAASKLDREYVIKAAFLYNFTKFAEWPDNKFTDTQSPVNICIFGQDPFGQAIDVVTEGKKIKGRLLEVKRIHDVADVDKCHMLFISSYGNTNMLDVLDRVANQSILTVADSKNFAEQGGMINLVTINNKIRLEINESVVNSSGVHLSSQLLKLAKIITSK